MSDNLNTIQRCPHDEANPYFMLTRALVRDNTISPNCRFMLIHLLSNKDRWEIKVSQIINEFSKWDGWGRDNVYKYIKEAVKAGYIRKEKYFVKGLTRIRYFLSEAGSFKESLRHTYTPHPVKPHAKERQYERQEEIYVNNDNIEEKPQDLSSFIKKEIIVFDLENMTFPDGTKLSLRTVRAFQKYQGKDRERLEANVTYFNSQIAKGKKPSRSYESWLQDCINKNYAASDLAENQNDIYAKFMKELHNLSNDEFKILKTIVIIKGDSISKRLPSQTFQSVINNFIKQRR